MSIKMVVSGRDVAECLEIEIDEDVLRCIIDTVQYRQINRKELKSTDYEVTYWLESGRKTMQRILSHQIVSRNELREMTRQESGNCPQ